MNTFGGYLLVDPRSLRTNRVRFRRDYIQALEQANSFYCPSGRYGSRGWLLLPRSDYNRLNKYSTTLQLSIGQDNLPTLQNLSIVQARCVTYGLASDLGAIYLIEITDARGILLNNWFQFPLTGAYNIRSPGYAGGFYSDSLNDGVAWTWATMLQDIWEQITLLGTWPGLPSTPTGTPEGFYFSGVSAWKALNDIVEYLGMTVACNLTQASPFTIVSAGATDAAFAALTTRYANTNNLEDDLEWIDLGSGRVPGSVIVLFRRRNTYYGSEETVRSDSEQWTMTSDYSVTVAAPVEFTGAVGIHYIWSDFTVRYDMDGAVVSADATTAAAIAAERVTQYYNKVYSSGYMTRTYSGALPFTTGSQVDSVKWYQDYSSQDRQAWKTKIVRGSRELIT